jgi:parallel beta-helix repeat protein
VTRPTTFIFSVWIASIVTIPIAAPAAARVMKSVTEMLQPLMSSTVSQSEPVETRRGPTAQATAAFDVNTGQAEGNFYYVASNGSDSNSGIEQQPFRTLKKGVSVLRPGDTLYVKNGTYIGSSQLRGIPSGSSWAAPVTIAAYPGHRPVIIPEPKDTALYFIGNHHIIVDGFIIDGRAQGDGIKITWETGVRAAHHIRIMNSEIKNAAQQGLIVTGAEAQFNEFINLNVHHNGVTCHDLGQCHGIYLSTENNLIHGGSWHDQPGYGIHIYNASDIRSPSHNVIKNAVIYANSSTGLGLMGGLENRAYNNIIYNNKLGIWVVTTDTLIRNNMVYNNNEAGIMVGSGRNTVASNVLYSNETGLNVYQHAGPISNVIIKNNLALKNRQNFKDSSGGGVTAQGNLFNDAYDGKFVDP